MSIDGWELKYFCEFDKYAEKSYCTIFNEDPKKNLGDITKVDETSLPYVKMMSAGSPCQSFSIAGSQEGSYWKCSECGHQWNPLLISPEKRKYCPVCGSAEHDHTKSAVLCGFVYCHGEKDLSCWEVNILKEDQQKIEEILAKYKTNGSSTRNVWDAKFSDVMSEEY